MMTHMKIRFCPSYHVISVTWYLRSSNAKRTMATTEALEGIKLCAMK